MRRARSAALLALAGLAAGAAPAPAQAARALADRPDDWPRTTPQLHVVYAVPSDGVDRALDTNGSLAASVDSFGRWLAARAGGAALRPDTHAGRLDVTFHRLSRTDAEVAATGAFVRDALERELAAAGLLSTHKLYAVYYDGSSTFACGGGAWPPTLPGRIAAMYLRGAPGGSRCPSDPVAAPGTEPGYVELAMLHELFHTLGAVAQCAPNHTLAGHTSDDPRDLMYAGPLPWRPSLLDPGRDDYFGHGRAGCLDLAASPFLSPLGSRPPPVAVAGLRALAPPRAGRAFTVLARVLGGPHAVRCEARIGIRRLACAVTRAGERLRCVVRVPPRTRGRTLSVELHAERGESAAGAGRSFRIR